MRIYKNKSFISVMLILLVFPGVALALTNISFIPSYGGIYNLVVNDESTSTLKLELSTLNDTVYITGDSIYIDTGITNHRAITIPFSLNNNQITDKIILVPIGRSGTDLVNKVYSVFMMDADLTNLNKIISIPSSILIEMPFIMKNNAGFYVVFGLGDDLIDTINIYGLDTLNNVTSSYVSKEYNGISKVLPLDDSNIIIINNDSYLKANIYNIVKQKQIAEYSLFTESNIRVDYDPNSYKTWLRSDLDDIDISDAPSPYGIAKIY